MINGELRQDLNAAWDRFRADEEAWVGIVTGTGGASASVRTCATARVRGQLARVVLGDPDDQLVRVGPRGVEADDRRGQRLLPGYGLTPCGVRLPDRRRQRGSRVARGAARCPDDRGRDAAPATDRLQAALELLLTGERFDAGAASDGLGRAGRARAELLVEARRLADRLCAARPSPSAP